jgi:hypothetical protein
MINITVNFSLRDTYNAHTVTFTSWDKVSSEITGIKPGPSPGFGGPCVNYKMGLQFFFKLNN